MKTTVFFLAITLATFTVAQDSNTSNGCLSDAALTAWGFKGTGKATKETEPKSCTNLYKDDGSCVEAGGVNTVIDELETKFTTNNTAWTNIDDTFTSFFKDVKGVLSDLWNKVTNSEKKEELTWEQQMGKAIKDAEDTQKECFINYNTSTHGLSCLLSSAKASSFVTVSGKQYTVTSDNNLLQLAKDCMPVLSAVCLYFKGADEAQVDAKQTAEQKAMCTEVINYQDCIDKGGKDTTCLNNDRKEKIIHNTWPTLNQKIFPSVEAVASTSEKIKAKFTEIKDKVFSWIKSVTGSDSSARILEIASDVKIVLKFSDTGANLGSYGKASGKEIKHTSIYSTLAGLLVLALSFL